MSPLRSLNVPKFGKPCYTYIVNIRLQFLFLITPCWTENDILSALTDVNKGFSIRSFAKHYRIPESSIRLRRSKEQSSVAVPLGRSPEFDSEIETKLAQCIRDLCQHGC